MKTIEVEKKLSFKNVLSYREITFRPIFRLTFFPILTNFKLLEILAVGGTFIFFFFS